MKKIISLLLAMVIAFSFASTAFAKTVSISLDEKKTVTVTSDEEKVYSFKAPSDGIFVVDAKITKGDMAYIYVEYDGNTVNYQEVFAEDEYTVGMSTVKVYFCAETGKTFKIYVGCHSIWELIPDATSKVSFTLSKYDASEIKLGKNQASKNGDVFLFVPEKTGYYNFRSDAASNVDPMIEVNDINGTVEINCDNGYENDRNFDLTVKLTKGKVYAIVLSFEYYYEDAVAKKYSFTVSYNKKIDVDYINLYYDNNKITLFKGNNEYLYYDVVPTGAAPKAEVAFDVENGNIADINLDEDGNVYLYANKVGKTTLTVSADGFSEEYKVVVYPMLFGAIYGFFMNIYYRIINIFNPNPVF